MADDREAGLIAAVDLILARTPGSQGEASRVLRAEQLALIPSATELAFQTDAERAERSGPGRPPGSRNKSTEDWTRFLTANYRDPRLFLAEAYSRPAAELGRELNCSTEAAFKLQLVAAKELLPYVGQKQPVAIAISSEREVTLVLVAPERRPAPTPGDGARLIAATVEDQALSPPEDPELDNTELVK